MAAESDDKVARSVGQDHVAGDEGKEAEDEEINVVDPLADQFNVSYVFEGSGDSLKHSMGGILATCSRSCLWLHLF